MLMAASKQFIHPLKIPKFINAIRLTELGQKCKQLGFFLLVTSPVFAIAQGDDTFKRQKGEVPQLAEKSGEADTAIGSFKKPSGFTCARVLQVAPRVI